GPPRPSSRGAPTRLPVGLRCWSSSPTSRPDLVLISSATVRARSARSSSRRSVWRGRCRSSWARSATSSTGTSPSTGARTPMVNPCARARRRPFRMRRWKDSCMRAAAWGSEAARVSSAVYGGRAWAPRRSEADHRAIYERSPIGIARISSGGELLEANPALLHMLEHDEETMRMSAWPDLMRAYDQAASRQRKAPFLAGITDGSSVQVRAATAAGSWLWLQLTATSIPDSSGRPEHVLVMVEDVTAVRETSDKLGEALEAQRDANANLEKIDHTKSEFLSIVSHEFRTALTGIQGFSELIRDGGLEPDEVRAYGR